jgi:DeoR/GlpR family transcriptional regulator of sugar metabolism
MTQAVSSTDRQNQILQIVAREQRISIGAICEVFSVSEATARRDLETLAEQGKLQRVHGGAIAKFQAEPELPILLRQQEQIAEKQRIGRAAAALIHDGETVFLGSGTTALEVARNLSAHKGLTVLSNSLPALNLLTGQPEITVVALGGMLRDSELSFIGHITEQALAEVRADKVILGVHALSLEDGLTNDYLPETMTDRAILRVGRAVIVVADHTKVNRVAPAFLAPVTSIHTFISDTGADPAFAQALKDLGIQVILV